MELRLNLWGFCFFLTVSIDSLRDYTVSSEKLLLANITLEFCENSEKSRPIEAPPVLLVFHLITKAQ